MVVLKDFLKVKRRISMIKEELIEKEFSQNRYDEAWIREFINNYYEEKYGKRNAAFILYFGKRYLLKKTSSTITFMNLLIKYTAIMISDIFKERTVMQNEKRIYTTICLRLLFVRLIL